MIFAVLRTVVEDLRDAREHFWSENVFEHDETHRNRRTVTRKQYNKTCHRKATLSRHELSSERKCAEARGKITLITAR